MKIVVDTEYDITQLFGMISENVRKIDKTAICLLETYITVSSKNIKIKDAVAETVASYIQKIYEKDFIRKHIKSFGILKSEIEEIVCGVSDDAELKKKRFDILKKEILDVIPFGIINVDGLLKFRLEEYKSELRFTAEYFMDEMSVQKSYDEFIGLMKYFAEIQTPVTDTVVISETAGEYRLTDSDGKPILLKFDEEFADELMPFDLSQEDLLISNLMAALPRRIVFNDIDKEKPIINTISKIFEGRISY